MDQETLFEKIAAKKIPSTVVYEDDLCFAFNDINPQAPVHVVLIPKKCDGLSQLSKAEDRHKEILGHLMLAVGKIAKLLNLENGFRIVVNDGKDAGQTVFHLHIHIFAGAPMFWPPGTPGPGGEGLKKN